jgi:hypothetical protein
MGGLSRHSLASAFGATALRRHGLRKLCPTGEIAGEQEEKRERCRNGVTGWQGQHSHGCSPSGNRVTKRFSQQKKGFYSRAHESDG